MSYELKGKLHKKYPEEVKSATFKSRDFVVMTEGEYPQYVKFQLVQDRTSLIDSIATGDTIMTYFDVRGREWEGKFFTNLQAWRVERDGAQGTADDTTPF